MSEKKKKQIRRMGALPFVGLWTAAYGSAWALFLIVGFAIDNFVSNNILTQVPSTVWAFLSVSFVGLLVGQAQQRLIQHKFAQVLTGWWWKSALAWGVTGGLWFNLIDNPAVWDLMNAYLLDLGEPIFFTFWLALLLVPPTIVQAWVLRAHIRRAWWWPAAAIVSAATFALVVPALNYANDLVSIVLMGAGGLLQGSVMGMVTIYLFNLTHRLDNPLEIAELSDDTRQGLESDTPDEQISYTDFLLAQERNEDFR